MLKCPKCGSQVERFKSGSHIMPRAILKRTKTGGRNVKWDLTNKKVAINQADERDEFWCDRCESESASDDAYGIDVLVHRSQATLDTLTLKNGARLKVLAGLDYSRFRKFLISIVIRAHLAGNRADGEPLLPDDQYRRLVEEYNGKTDDAGITASFLAEHDPVSQMVTSPVRSRAKGRDQLPDLQLSISCLLHQDSTRSRSLFNETRW